MLGGRVLDPSALVAYAHGWIGMRAWMDMARDYGMTLLLPGLAFSEARWVFPDRLTKFGEVLDHSQVLYKILEPAAASRVAVLLDKSGCWDATAGHVILEARERRWPVLSADPQRLTRIAPDLDVELLP